MDDLLLLHISSNKLIDMKKHIKKLLNENPHLLGEAENSTHRALANDKSVYIFPNRDIPSIDDNGDILKVGLYERSEPGYIDLEDYLKTHGYHNFKEEDIPSLLGLEHYHCEECEINDLYNLGMQAYLRRELYLKFFNREIPQLMREYLFGFGKKGPSSMIVGDPAPLPSLNVPPPPSVTEQGLAAASSVMKQLSTEQNKQIIKQLASPENIAAVKKMATPENIAALKKAGKKVSTPATRKALKEALNWIYRGTKLGSTALGTGLSLGAAGDTIPDLIFLVLDVGVLAASLGQLAIQGGYWGKKIYNIPFPSTKDNPYGGPIAVKNEMAKIFKEIDSRMDAQPIYDKLCSAYKGSIDSIASAFGSLISTFVPDDPGLIRITIEIAVKAGQAMMDKATSSFLSPFTILKNIYDRVPRIGKDIMEDPVKMKELLLKILKVVTDFFPQKGDTFTQKAKKNIKRISLGTAAGLGPLLLSPISFIPVTAGFLANFAASFGITGQMIVDIVNKYIAPNIDTFVALVQKILPLGFATALLLEKCSNPQMVLTIDDKDKVKDIKTTPVPLQVNPADIPQLPAGTKWIPGKTPAVEATDKNQMVEVPVPPKAETPPIVLNKEVLDKLPIVIPAEMSAPLNLANGQDLQALKDKFLEKKKAAAERARPAVSPYASDVVGSVNPYASDVVGSVNPYASEPVEDGMFGMGLFDETPIGINPVPAPVVAPVVAPTVPSAKIAPRRVNQPIPVVAEVPTAARPKIAPKRFNQPVDEVMAEKTFPENKNMASDLSNTLINQQAAKGRPLAPGRPRAVAVPVVAENPQEPLEISTGNNIREGLKSAPSRVRLTNDERQLLELLKNPKVQKALMDPQTMLTLYKIANE